MWHSGSLEFQSTITDFVGDTTVVRNIFFKISALVVKISRKAVIQSYFLVYHGAIDFRIY